MRSAERDISYYAEISHYGERGPVGLARRRRHPTGGFFDESFTSGDTWEPTSSVVKYQSMPELGEYFVPITDDEAAGLRQWFHDRSAVPPLIGGWSVGCAWSALLAGGTPITQLINRLDLIPHGSLDDPNEHDPAFRILRNDAASRVTLTIFRGWRPDRLRWVIAIDYLHEEPSEALVHDIRKRVLTVAQELGYEKEDESWDDVRSVSVYQGK